MTANMDGGAARRAPGPHFRWQAGPDRASVEELDRSLAAARGWMVDRQYDDGYWVAEMEGDSILESEYVLLMAYFGREHEARCVKLARCLLEQQAPDGGWAIYPGGPTDVSASVKAYFALKLVGVPTTDPGMVRAREAILEAGGVGSCNSFTRFYLALLGQIGYEDTPCIPPELAMIPYGWLLGRMSAWTRPIVMTLSIISAYKPVRDLPTDRGIAELFRLDLPKPSRRTKAPVSWTNTFLGLDRSMKWLDAKLPGDWRKPGIRAAHRWILEHFESSDGLGAIIPPMIYSLVALQCLGYANNDPTVSWAWRHLDDLIIEEGDTIRIQPCMSPVWDTAITTIALADAGLPARSPALLKAGRWLLDKEVRTPGDWSAKRREVEPSGWFFQFQNGLYPDIDDTAMVLMAIHRTGLAGTDEVDAATRRGVDWLLAMQNRDGGWAAFDVDITLEILTKIPFADHNAILDPSCPDITARIIELLGTLGFQANHPAVARGLDYLWRTQEPQGSWFGRWGVNYIYGTWQVLQGLRALRLPTDHPAIVRAADWLESVQQADGAWGESCKSYEDPTSMGRGEPTASQTAWGLLGLVHAGRARGEAASRAAGYLIETQRDDGRWEETAFTGTGFPLVFYMKYHYYQVYFPMMALGRYRTAALRAVEAGVASSGRVAASPRPLDI